MMYVGAGITVLHTMISTGDHSCRSGTIKRYPYPVLRSLLMVGCQPTCSSFWGGARTWTSLRPATARSPQNKPRADCSPCIKSNTICGKKSCGNSFHCSISIDLKHLKSPCLHSACAFCHLSCGQGFRELCFWQNVLVFMPAKTDTPAGHINAIAIRYCNVSMFHKLTSS